MDSVRISALLDPFVARPLPEAQLKHISTYIDMLTRWNQKLNLTAVRAPEHIVTRHFGESLFAARNLFAAAPAHCGAPLLAAQARLIDVGSGAGFPGLPIKISFPELSVTLIESNHKKATFLREVIRALGLTSIDVFTGRAEDFPARAADVVTLRAVERFETVVPTAARLLREPGELVLLIGNSQVARATQLLPSLRWEPPLPVPVSSARALLIGRTATPLLVNQTS
jgi:16S rRNA (guanine527-N7)-methyltransferase